VTARGKRRGRRATASRARARGRSARRAVDAATLMEAAERARSRAHAPYSHFTVGAALLTRRGTIVTGCNVENASYGLTICAERVAVFNAVAAGERDFVAIAVAAGAAAAPCGACRQVLGEFAPRLDVYFRGAGGRVVKRRLDQLLPEAFALRTRRAT